MIRWKLCVPQFPLSVPSFPFRPLISSQYLAVSSSSRPWIDVFALPGKFNMAVTESDLEPKVRKMSITFFTDCATPELSMRAWNWNVTDSKKNYFLPDYSPIYSDMTVQRNIPRFCTRSICGWNLFQQLGLHRTRVHLYVLKYFSKNWNMFNKKNRKNFAVLCFEIISIVIRIGVPFEMNVAGLRKLFTCPTWWFV